jgi:hypothetical protein
MHRGSGRLVRLAVIAVVVSACTSGTNAVVPPATSTNTTAAAGSVGAAAPVGPAPTATGASTTGAASTAAPVSAVVAENAKPGTADWRIPAGTGRQISGYADTTSAQRGDTVTLFVSSTADWDVTAYRMGWYGGDMGRLVWRSPTQKAAAQPGPTVDSATHMAEARWSPSLRVAVGTDWVPGDYLLVLRSSDGGAHDVPLTVRDENSSAALVIVNAVTTWQAYNTWGGCSLYVCPGLKGVSRATVVSFDRPYDHGYNNGSADFLDHELSLVALAEQLGVDVTYVTDVDLDRNPGLVLRHKGVVSLGHDEYYSAAMRGGLVAARDAGVNLAFLGANAIYRRIRLEPSWDGRARRHEVNYRTMSDPAAKTDPKAATVQWRLAPLNLPEAQIVGVQYACSPVSADLRIVDPSSWVFAGTGATDGMTLPKVVANEYDRVFLGPWTPPNLEVLAHSPLTCRGKSDFADMAYYSAPSGAGVFASASIHWICSIDGLCPTTNEAAAVVRQVTANVLTAFAAGPAGAVHPSVANVAALKAGTGGASGGD